MPRSARIISSSRTYHVMLRGINPQQVFHLLIKTGEEEIGQVMKRVGVRFVQRINRKYGRSGHLFQDRYKSEAVQDDSCFLTLIRYIHQNPVKAGLTATVAGYPAART